MQRETRRTLVAFTLVATALVVILWPMLSESTFGRHASEREVERLVASLEIGSTPETVEGIFSAGGYTRLTLRKIDHTSWWAFETPSVFGATNWVLYVEFTDRRLARVYVRTVDSRDIYPDGAPPDKGVTR